MAANSNKIPMQRAGISPEREFPLLWLVGTEPPGTVIADAAIGLLEKLAERLGYDLH